MNSVEALTYALRKLEAIKINPQRADALERAIELQQAITTLEALRDMIAEQPAAPWRVEQQQPDGSWKPA